jgi:hypothetical protein
MISELFGDTATTRAGSVATAAVDAAFTETGCNNTPLKPPIRVAEPGAVEPVATVAISVLIVRGINLRSI